MAQNNFHKNFKLNNNSFTNVDELLAYTFDFSKDNYQFLKSWFSDSDFIIVQTSGSTGKPKPIQLKKELMRNSAFATGVFFKLKENTTALLCLPVEYIAGKMMLVRALTLGWHIDVVDSNSNPLEAIKQDYDFSAMVPLQVENSIKNLYKIKKLIVGGGVVSNQLQEKLQNISTEVFATYGMTETITHIAVKKLNNITSLRGRMIKQSLFNEFYKTLPNVNIYKDVKSCLVIDAQKVSEEIIFTNDVVNLISENQFEWLGRFDNVINSGGIKLHPEKIEEKLSKIIENRFFVIGIPDDKLGEKLVLIIEGVISSTVGESLKILKSLSKFEIPKEIYFVDEFVETETGKIQRKMTFKKVINYY
ncbi:MAG: AMP-binding protein [Polaribacter sp.]|uniref:AMP-binding protein n=1 Tax=Polaribacter sp. TaxID=1920175 RepID=UPI002F352E7B